MNRLSIAAAATTKKQTSRACVLPENFTPNDTCLTMAAELGLSVPAEQAAFADHHTANGSTFKDWQAAFRTWLRNSAKFAQRAKRGGGFQQSSSGKYAAAAATIYDGVNL